MRGRQHSGAKNTVAEVFRGAKQPVRGRVQRAGDESENLPFAQQYGHELP